MRGPGSRNSAACHGGSRLAAVLAVPTLATYKPPEPSTPAGASAAQDLRSGPGPIGGEWPDPFQNDSDRHGASASETVTAAAVDVIDAASSSHSS